MFHPWRLLRALEHVRLEFAELPEGTVAASGPGLIVLDSRLSQAERRSALTHEILHILAGHRGRQPQAVERAVELGAARLLIPMDLLLDKLAWTEDLDELAEECHVDRQMLMARLDGLTEAERSQIQALAERMEPWTA